MIDLDRTTYTPADLLHFREAGTLILTPKFQRRSIWSSAARSYFIDTLIQGMPVPPIYLRVAPSIDHLMTVREVVDGQQRLISVFDYIAGRYSLARTLPREYAGKQFDDLATSQQDAIRHFGFNCEVFHGLSDAQVLEIFARLNTFSVRLNRQELRNGRYFGYFKQTAYSLAYDYVELWRSLRIFSETTIARMMEVEFVSELMIVAIAGMQDKKTSIDHFYANFETSFGNRGEIVDLIRNSLDIIADSVGDVVPHSEFNRVPLFYSLVCTVMHRIRGIPNAPSPQINRRLTRDAARTLRAAVEELSRSVEEAKEFDDTSRVAHADFVLACLRQTDNIEPRKIRFQVLHQLAFEQP